VLAITGACVLSACGFGVTLPAGVVSDTTAEVNGRVHNTVAETTEYWYEYGQTTEYGQSSPHRTVSIASPSSSVLRSVRLTDLDEDTTYHYRICARGADGVGSCGSDRAFTTTKRRDSVVGSGTVFVIPEFDLGFGASSSASSGPDGESPIEGSAALSPGTFFNLPDFGPATCLRVDGNRAAIGFVYDQQFDPGRGPIPRTLFVEDNGPTGDRIEFSGLAAPHTMCPDPNVATFPPFDLGYRVVPAILTSGDFVVHDHVDP
jgi:hypothetical protein